MDLLQPSEWLVSMATSPTGGFMRLRRPGAVLLSIKRGGPPPCVLHSFRNVNEEEEEEGEQWLKRLLQTLRCSFFLFFEGGLVSRRTR